MNLKGLLIATEIEGVRTRKDRTLAITMGTQELSPEQAGQVISLIGKITATYISVKDIKQDEVDKVDKVDGEFGTKSQSQRLRGVFYKLFEQDPEGYQDFNLYYHFKMEQLITHYKLKIDA